MVEVDAVTGDVRSCVTCTDDMYWNRPLISEDVARQIDAERPPRHPEGLG